MTSFERFICERENFVFDSLIYLEPVERFKNRSNVSYMGKCVFTPGIFAIMRWCAVQLQSSANVIQLHAMYNTIQYNTVQYNTIVDAPYFTSESEAQTAMQATSMQ